MNKKNGDTIILIIGVVVLIIGIIGFFFIKSNYMSKEFIYEQTKECRDKYENKYLGKNHTLKEVFFSPKLSECVIADYYNNNDNTSGNVLSGYYIQGLSSNTSFWYKLDKRKGEYYNYYYYVYDYYENEKVISHEEFLEHENKEYKVEKDRLKKIEKLKRWY